MVPHQRRHALARAQPGLDQALGQAASATTQIRVAMTAPRLVGHLRDQLDVREDPSRTVEQVIEG
jgi:hypothetical protein